ncbi:MAG: endonuclease III [Chitinophagaceae bacterium]|nr:endonuclease III [Chitinophagaceae bacterium]
MTRKERYEGILAYFEQHQPNAATELDYESPFQLLVSVILSAQCTDKRVNLTTPALFARFPDPETLSKATAEEVFPLVKSISYPNNKAKFLVAMAKMLIEKFNGEVPSDIDQLQLLPGVGRKTANVIASCVFNQPKMAVDTHVFRVSARLGLTKGAKNPLQTELQLIRHIPEDKIYLAHHWLILHGRYVCLARSPKCSECAIRQFCSYYEKLEKKNFLRQNRTVKASTAQNSSLPE